MSIQSIVFAGLVVLALLGLMQVASSGEMVTKLTCVDTPSGPVCTVGKVDIGWEV